MDGRKIERILAWYDNIDTTNPGETLTKLIRARRRLSVESVAVAKMVALSRADSDRSEWLRKRKYGELKLRYAQEASATIAETKANASDEVNELKEAEIESMKDYQNARLLLEQINKVLDSMSTDIRNMEAEYRRINQMQLA